MKTALLKYLMACLSVDYTAATTVAPTAGMTGVSSAASWAGVWGERLAETWVAYLAVEMVGL